MTATRPRSVVHDSFTLERTYPVPPQRVFAAWSDREAKRLWFGAAGDDDVESFGAHTLDFRVGGREHLEGAVPGGGEFTYDAVYNDIVDGERIVFSYDMHLFGKRISVSVATVEIIAVAGGTALVLTEQGAFLDGLDTNEQRREGTAVNLDLLGTSLAATA
jgi:uncharacterized protein YndB with AHSA1/START domain